MIDPVSIHDTSILSLPIRQDSIRSRSFPPVPSGATLRFLPRPFFLCVVPCRLVSRMGLPGLTGPRRPSGHNNLGYLSSSVTSLPHSFPPFSSVFSLWLLSSNLAHCTFRRESDSSCQRRLNTPVLVPSSPELSFNPSSVLIIRLYVVSIKATLSPDSLPRNHFCYPGSIKKYLLTP